MNKTALSLDGIREVLSRDQMKLVIGEYGSYRGITCSGSVIINNEIIEASGTCASNNVVTCNQYVTDWCVDQYKKAGVPQGNCTGSCA